MSSPTGTEIHFKELGGQWRPMFWGHGWGHSLENLLPLAQSLENSGHHWVIDFPGFGKSPPPPGDWGTAEYADALAEFIKSKTDQKIIWIGHSFGCRVGLQLAARHPELIDGLFLIAAAGLPRIKNPIKKLYFKGRIRLYKLLKKLIPFGLPEQWLLKTFASRDYLNSGPLRTILIKTVNENLSDIAAQVRCPVTFIYGSNDTETPPNIGERFCKIIPNAELIVLDGYDHYTILTEARHQVAHRLHSFIKGL
jgi:pimeloyl-ACP methyl ester carboxylesterase